MFEHVPNTVLYNENLEPPNNTATVPDSHGGRISGETLINQGVGWQWAPLPPEPRQGEQPQAVTYAPVVPEVEPQAIDYDAMTVPELQEELRKRDLPTTGNKGELIERLTDDDAEPNQEG